MFLNSHFGDQEITICTLRNLSTLVSWALRNPDIKEFELDPLIETMYLIEQGLDLLREQSQEGIELVRKQIIAECKRA